MTAAVRYGTTIDELGEGPVWDDRNQTLYWFDVVKRLLRRRDKNGDGRDIALDRMPGSMAFRENGGVLFAFRNAITIADKAEGPYQVVDGHDIDFGRERINDGAVDRRGRFWFGTFSPRFEAGAGGLYRLDPDRRVHRMDTGLTMSNGIAWSPDDTVLYFADSRPGRIYRYAFSIEQGTIGPRDVFLDYADRPGRPDGLTVDADGYVWVAEVTASRVARYDPHGRLDRVVAVPTGRPTSVAFIGADLDTLFITSMHHGMDAEERDADALAGAAFTADANAKGIAEPRFGG